MSSAPPVIANRYAIEQLAASGGMATLYRARDESTGHAVAVKLLRESLSSSGEERFFREAALLRSLAHPAIVRYVDHGIDERGRPYLVMGWLDGEALDAVLRRRGLTPSEALSLALRVATALSYCHGLHVVHRDVKPANIVLPAARPEDAILVDFGIATLVTERSRGTVSGLLLGTPRYMSPEQMRSARRVDGRADVFALGCVLYECLTGRHAFDAGRAGGPAAGDVYAYAARLAQGEATPLRTRRPDLPSSVDALLSAMLVRDREHRPFCDEGLVESLQREQQALSQAALPAALPLLEPAYDSAAFEAGLGAPAASDGATIPTGAELLAPGHALPRGLAAPSEPVSVWPESIRNATRRGGFFGREEARAALREHLRGSPGIAVLWGPAGMGKTRLAYEASFDLVEQGGGVKSVVIADVREATDAPSIARAVSAALGVDVPALSAESTAMTRDGAVHAVALMLRARRDAVVVLDGADACTGAAAAAAVLFVGPPAYARVLITSRVRLRATEALDIELGPLSTEAACAYFRHLALHHGVALKAAPTSDGEPDLTEGGGSEQDAIARIVRAVEGNPLALEIAAARLSLLGALELATRLEQPEGRIDDGGGGLARTMREALAWSYRLLDQDEQRALVECTIFKGSFSARAAEAILTPSADRTALDVLQALREKSLLTVSADRADDVRLALPRTVREFAALLATGDELRAVRRRHGAYFARDSWDAVLDHLRTGTAESLSRLEASTGELVAVMERAVTSSTDMDALRDGVRVAVAAEPLAAMRGSVGPQIDLLRQAPHHGLDDRLVAHALRVRGTLLGRRGDPNARKDLEAALALARALSDAELAAETELALGALLQWNQEYPAARALYESVIEGTGASGRAEARAIANLAALAHDELRFDEARALYEEATALLESCGDARLAAILRTNSAVLLQELGELDEARSLYDEAARALAMLRDERLLGITLGNLGMLDLEEERITDALARHAESRKLLARVGDARSEVMATARYAAALAWSGRVREALAAAVGAERRARRFDAVAQGTARLLRAFVDVAQAGVAKSPVAAESALEAARARVREARSPGPDGAPPVTSRSDDVRTALRILTRWTNGLVG